MNTSKLTVPAARLLLGLAALSQFTVLQAQDLPYSSGSTGADGALRFREIPVSGRREVAGAYDTQRGELIIYGGHNSASQVSDTWKWDGTDWKQISTVNNPGPRRLHRMVYDAERKQIVLFGGYRDGIGALSDTWVWDSAAQAWQEKTPADKPTARYQAHMVYDASRKKIVLFGGSGANDETLTWDGVNWTTVTTATRPPNQADVAIGYHAGTQRVVMFNSSAQTWLWDGVNWTQASPLTIPQGRGGARMAWDGSRNELVMFGGNGLNETWVWNGSNWIPKSPASVPPKRAGFVFEYDAARGKLVAFGGSTDFDNTSADTYLWNGTDWTFWSGKDQRFNMTARADGIWNFTSIDVPPGITIYFTRNAGNTPVRWLATEGVTIRGTIDVSGEFGANSLPPNVVAAGGPGGFEGGRGATRKAQSGSSVGSPGQGPGGGLPGTDPNVTSPKNLRDGEPGAYSGSYGNAFIQPLIGGSGGGGGSSNDNTPGGNGGGGAGAILIASSRDIVVDGAIRANGGDVQWTGTSYGGRGSGGAILLRADRISGSGQLQAVGGSTSFPNGRIRLEAYYRSITAEQTAPVSVNSVPSANKDFNTVGSLLVTKVAGSNVSNVPTGNTLTPDIVFTQAGTISVEVAAVGVPNGTPIKLRIATATGVITPATVNLAGGTATFNGISVPAGVGTIQAFAEFNTSN